jgi:hypothetical protein
MISEALWPFASIQWQFKYSKPCRNYIYQILTKCANCQICINHQMRVGTGHYWAALQTALFLVE